MADQQATGSSRRQNVVMSVALGAVGSAFAICVLPYSLAIVAKDNPGIIERVNLKKVIPLGFVQGLVSNGLMVYAGLHLGRSLHLDAPLFRKLVASNKKQANEGKDGINVNTVTGKSLTKKSFFQLAAAGMATGIVVFALDGVFLKRYLPDLLGFAHGSMPALWKRSLACFYGGFTEELLIRMFLTTVVAKGFSKAQSYIRRFSNKQQQQQQQAKSNKGQLSAAHWCGIGIAALVFAAGHLPLGLKVLEKLPYGDALAPDTPRFLGLLAPTTTFVLRILAVNFSLGLPLGAIFAKYGLESSMVLHFFMDVGLHLLAPALLSLRLFAPTTTTTAH